MVMTQTEKPKAVEAPPSRQADLAKLLEQSVAKEPDERVRCVRVFENYYRCNWWRPCEPTASGTVTIDKIARSKFLRATMTANGLSFDDMSEGGKGRTVIPR
jgi:hypothetical protein